MKQDNRPTISIIIPIFNAEKTLRCCLNSLKEQTYDQIQVLMIDDGSTDSTKDICNEFTVDKRFEYYCADHGGVSAARNYGLKKAFGSWIGFCDSDDSVSPVMFETLIKNALENECDISVCGFRRTEKNPFTEQTRVDILNPKEALVQMHSSEGFEGYIWNKIIKKELFKGIEFPENIYISEDAVTLGFLIMKSNRIAVSNAILYNYVYNGQSATKKGYFEKYWTAIDASGILYSQLEKIAPEYICYGEKYYILRYLEIAYRLAISNMLDRNEYKKICEGITPWLNNKSRSLFNAHQLFKLNCYLFNRFIFIIVSIIYSKIR